MAVSVLGPVRAALWTIDRWRAVWRRLQVGGAGPDGSRHRPLHRGRLPLAFSPGFPGISAAIDSIVVQARRGCVGSRDEIAVLTLVTTHAAHGITQHQEFAEVVDPDAGTPKFCIRAKETAHNACGQHPVRCGDHVGRPGLRGVLFCLGRKSVGGRSSIGFRCQDASSRNPAQRLRPVRPDGKRANRACYSDSGSKRPGNLPDVPGLPGKPGSRGFADLSAR